VTILGNLIDNAVDAASEAATGWGGDPLEPGPVSGRPLRARVAVTARADHDELLLRVADSGAGIDPADADEVFRRGWSTHGAGRGLGLALVKQAAHRSRGTVTLAQGPDGGAEFTVRLPLHTAEVPA
jgi:two-component system, CitB family, sensor kinase